MAANTQVATGAGTSPCAVWQLHSAAHVWLSSELPHRVTLHFITMTMGIVLSKTKILSKFYPNSFGVSEWKRYQ